MKVNQYEDKTLREDYVAIHYQQETEKITAIVEYLRHLADEKIRVRMADNYGYIPLSKVLYVESVDRKYMANLNDESWPLETAVTLKELSKRYEKIGFVRVSKSLLLNSYQVENVVMDLNMRMLAHLKNGEIIQINRSYKKQFNQALVMCAEGKIK